MAHEDEDVRTILLEIACVETVIESVKCLMCIPENVLEEFIERLKSHQCDDRFCRRNSPENIELLEAALHLRDTMVKQESIMRIEGLRKSHLN